MNAPDIMTCCMTCLEIKTNKTGNTMTLNQPKWTSGEHMFRYGNMIYMADFTTCDKCGDACIVNCVTITSKPQWHIETLPVMPGELWPQDDDEGYLCATCLL